LPDITEPEPISEEPSKKFITPLGCPNAVETVAVSISAFCIKLGFADEISVIPVAAFMTARGTLPDAD
jgi:hypothetical protein